MNRSMLIVAGAVVALALFAGGYTLGTSSAQAKPVAATVAPGAADAGARGANGRGGGAPGGFNAPVNGRIISVNADSITIAVNAPRVPGTAGQPSASPAAASAIVLIGSGTRVVRTTETEIKLTDLKANDAVTIVGPTDPATGTVSAQAVVVGGNALGNLFGGGAPGGPPGGPPAGPPGAPRPSASPTR